MESRDKRRCLSKVRFRSDNGFLMVSTLYFVIFSALFAQSMIKIASNQMLQLNQLSNSYQAKAALNMGKELLLQELEENKYPSDGQITTSIGVIEITYEEVTNGMSYHLILTSNSGITYKDRYYFEIIDLDDKPLEDIEIITQSDDVTI